MDDILKQFFQEAIKCAAGSKEEVYQAFESQNFLLYHGVTFKTSQDFKSYKAGCIKSIQRKYKEEVVSERDISDLLNRHAAELALENDSNNLIKSRVRKFKDDITLILITYNTYISANYSIKLAEDVDKLKIGPVSCLHTKDIHKFLEKVPDFFEVTNSEDSKLILGAKNKHEIGLGEQCFVVDLVSSKNKIKSVAKWHVDVATSFLRIFIMLSKTSNYQGPFMGNPESLPFTKYNKSKIALIKVGDGFSTTAYENIFPYTVTKDLIVELEKLKFQETAEIIFNYKEKTVSERVNRCLGWMARARQSIDLGERFLYLFTALEALLTREDKNAPVVETVARNVATIIANNENRYEIHKRVKVMYAIRSDLVHSGRNGVTETDSTLLQFYTELVCAQVIEKAINTEVQDFHDSLIKASFGGDWIS